MLALRRLARRPAYTLAVIAMFAVGIAASTAIFSVFNGMFLSSLPFPAADRLVYLNESVPSRNLDEIGISFLDIEEWRANSQAFDHIAGYYDGGGFNLSTGGGPVRVHGASVTFDMAATLGIKPILGRDFLPSDDRTGAPRIIMLGYNLWQREFEGRAAIIGNIVRLDTIPCTVIGVLPSNAVFPAGDDFWYPRASFLPDGARILNGVGRLKLGMNLQQARADLTRVLNIPGSGRQSLVGKGKLQGLRVEPVVAGLRDHFLDSYRPVTKVLFGAVVILLLISCANIGAWMIARGTSRTREFAVRAAIGASRRTLIQQLLIESFVLAAIGAIAGIGVGWLALRAMVSLMPDVLPAWVKFGFDARFAGFALLVTAAAAIISGLAPALLFSRVDLRGFLTGAHASASRAQWHSMNLFVVGEIALTFVVLVAAGLVLSAFHKVMSVDPGFQAQNVVTFDFDFDEKYQPSQWNGFYREMIERLRAIPGVESTGATDIMPLDQSRKLSGYFQAEGEALRSVEDEPAVPVRFVTPGYLRSMGIALTAGREFEERDGADNIIVNEAFAARFWPRGTNVVEKRVRMRVKDSRWLRVSGVVRDVRQDGLDRPIPPAVYLPNSFQPIAKMTIVLRSTVGKNALIASVRAVIHQMDPDLTIFNIQTMEERLDRSLWERRTYSWLFGVFAGVALVMAMAGIYGVVSYLVTQRTREIGVRIALGAEPRRVVGQVLLRSIILAAVGIALGLAGALASTRLLQSLLAGVSPYDPSAFGAMSVVLVAAVLAATVLPARRAATIDPTTALRFE